jgi:hypothetical protein
MAYVVNSQQYNESSQKYKKLFGGFYKDSTKNQNFVYSVFDVSFTENKDKKW